MFAIADTMIDDARHLQVGDIMAGFGEVTELSITDDEFVNVVFYDGFDYSTVSFHTYEDVELLIL